ncbi:MAG: hypothetical protein AAGF47_04945 [Planctomycetota bacterium]
MDDRTTQIKEGAGLEESRINTEFIELLQKWSSPILLILALIVGAYAGNNWLKAQRNNTVNEAFQNHAEITETASPSPASLSAVAAEHRDIKAVGILAKLRHGRILLESVRTGGKPGAEFETDEDGAVIGTYAEADRLTEDDRARALDQAAGLFQEAADLAGDDLGNQIHRIAASFGLAAVAETRGDLDAARRAYGEASAAAEAASFPAYIALADERIASLDAGAIVPVALFSDADLPEPPQPEPEPEPAPGTEPTTDLDAPAGPIAPEPEPKAGNEPASPQDQTPDETGGG